MCELYQIKIFNFSSIFIVRSLRFYFFFKNLNKYGMSQINIFRKVEIREEYLMGYYVVKY